MEILIVQLLFLKALTQDLMWKRVLDKDVVAHLCYLLWLAEMSSILLKMGNISGINRMGNHLTTNKQQLPPTL